MQVSRAAGPPFAAALRVAARSVLRDPRATGPPPGARPFPAALPPPSQPSPAFRSAWRAAAAAVPPQFGGPPPAMASQPQRPGFGGLPSGPPPQVQRAPFGGPPSGVSPQAPPFGGPPAAVASRSAPLSGPPAAASYQPAPPAAVPQRSPFGGPPAAASAQPPPIGGGPFTAAQAPTVMAGHRAVSASDGTHWRVETLWRAFSAVTASAVWCTAAVRWGLVQFSQVRSLRHLVHRNRRHHHSWVLQGVMRRHRFAPPMWQGQARPAASSEFIVKDTGNCNPRLMRCTMNQIPCTGDLLTTSGMPLALLVQPFALPHPSEEPIQLQPVVLFPRLFQTFRKALEQWLELASFLAMKSTGGKLLVFQVRLGITCEVYYITRFLLSSDPAKLYNDLRWNISRPAGFEAVMRVRCSQGLQVQDYFGNFCKRVPTDIDLPVIDSDKAIMVTFKHDDKLQENSECAFQLLLIDMCGSYRGPFCLHSGRFRGDAHTDLTIKDDDDSLVPSPLTLNSENIHDDGIYLLENGEDGFIYVGNSVNPLTLEQILVSRLWPDYQIRQDHGNVMCPRQNFHCYKVD
ncbi:hypothetical protein HU200_065851 [Digitaria exilis]|uniref:Sec23/Sec24 beta-sandwich domain-containing protein n=1 Tax=Digitaria exilis TaxID=1010633 RepID=A0A835A8T8_9POAL|nr:hypothetical protein HU200_065851 [Digitaria exilis]